MKAMIFAAGLGTRLNEETADKPKALVKVGGKPLLQLAIDKLQGAGVEEIVVNVHHFSELVISFLTRNDFSVPVHISDESDKLLDTGGGLKKAAHFFSGTEPVLVYNVDILSDLNIRKLIKEHLNSSSLATLVVRKRKTLRYLKFDGNRNLVGWLNKKTGEKRISQPESFMNATEMAFSGIHVVQPEIFKLMPAAGKFSIIDLYLELAKSHRIKGYFDDSKLWMDVGKPDQLKKARELFPD